MRSKDTLGEDNAPNLLAVSHHHQKSVPNANIAHRPFQLLKDIRRRLGNEKVTPRQNEGGRGQTGGRVVDQGQADVLTR